MIEFFDKAGNRLAERFAAAEDFSSLLHEVLTMSGFRVEGYTGDFLAVYQAIRSWHGDWRYELKMTSDGRFILTSLVADSAANARISELVIALEWALQATGCDGDLCIEDWHESARKAIAKAEEVIK